MGQQASGNVRAACPWCLPDGTQQEEKSQWIRVDGQEAVAEEALFEGQKGKDAKLHRLARMLHKDVSSSCPMSCGIDRHLQNFLGRVSGQEDLYTPMVPAARYEGCPGTHVPSLDAKHSGTYKSHTEEQEEYHTRAEAPEAPIYKKKDYRDSLYAGHTGQLPTQLASLRKEQRNFLQKYTLGKRLAAGAQGVAYVATENTSGRKVVVKKPNSRIDIDDYIKLKDKTHPNIVRVFDLFQNDLDTYVVLEFCEGGDLFSAVEGSPGSTTTANFCASVMKQVFEAAKYLHVHFQQSHNDIKPENILLDRKVSEGKEAPRAMLADFGCLGPIGKVGTDDGGDPRYRAPETFKGELFSDKTDAWALGVSLFEVITGGLMIHINKPNVSGWMKFVRTPDCKRLMTMLEAKKPVDLSQVPADKSDPVGKQLHDLLSGLFNTSAKKRTTVSAALESPWFKLPDKGQKLELPKEVSERLRKRSRMKVMSVALLNLIGEQLQGESIQYYQKIWSKYDASSTGKISFTEFRAMVEELGVVGGKDQPTAEAFFALADVDRSGLVEFNEFVALMFDPDKLRSADRATYFKRAFYFLSGDTNKISATQFAKLFENQGQESQAIIKRLFTDMDTNKNGSIDYKEFCAYIDSL